MAENIKRHITHIKSKVVEEGSPKLPTSSQIELGELAINYAKGFETLSIKNESGDVVTFNTDTFYGTCTTAAATKDKVVTLSNASGWRLKSGVIVGVKFSNSNSFSGGTDGYPTLNVNSSGAKYIWYNTTSANTGTNNTAYGTANRISYYMYDGIGWVWVNQSIDNNTTYSTMSAAELSAGTKTTQRVMTAANLKTGGNAIWQAKGSYLTGTTKYAGASTQGGAATSAEKLSNTAAIGSATNPVFFTANGVPSACTYSLNKTVPSDAVFTDTDTKVTAVGNHYTPTATSADTKSATASSTSELNWGNAVVTGVTLSGDAKGHITSVTVSSGKLKTPVTGVTLASGTNNGTVKLTVNGSATDNIAVKGLGTAAYKAEGYFAGSGHSHSNYVVTGRTVSTASGLTGGGNLSANRTIGLAATGTSGTYYCVKTDAYGRVTSGNTSNPNTDTAVTQTNITTNGNYEVLLAGSTATATTTTEASKNVGITYNPSTSALTVNKKITTIAANNFITGSGTSATTATVETATYCYPAKWSYNKATTVADGDMFTIKIPIAGHTYGVYMSVNNGTNYYPIVLNGTARLTTQYPVNSYITVVYETGGTAASIYPVNGAASGSTGTSAAGVFRVVNYYDSNTTYSVVDNTYLRYNTLKAANAIYRYQLLLTKDETSLLPINSNSNTTATTKTITNSKFDPFGNIYYYGVTETTNANTAIPTGRTYQEILFDLRYSFNTNKTLTASKSVYLVATPQDDGTAIIANRTTTGVSINGPISQTLPATDNGLIYIYLGTAYSTYQVNLSLTHPIYQYKNGTLNQYVGSFGSMAYEDSTSYSSATEVNTALAGKSGTGHTHDDRYYTESELTGSSTTVVVAKASSATTAASAGSVAWGNVSGKPSSFKPSAHNQASNTITTMAGYSKPSSTSAIATGDTLNSAVGKLENALDGKVNTSNIVTAITSSNSGSTDPIATKVVAENELTVSNALNDLNTKKLDASAYTSVHYSKVSVTGNLTNVTCPVTLSTDGEQCNVLYVNDSTQHTVSVSTNYKSLDNNQINLTIKANGYAEVNYLYFGGDIYVRAV